MFKNFHNSLNSLEYQYSVHNSLLHLLLTHFIFFEQCVHFNALYLRSERVEQLCFALCDDEQ